MNWVNQRGGEMLALSGHYFDHYLAGHIRQSKQGKPSAQAMSFDDALERLNRTLVEIPLGRVWNRALRSSTTGRRVEAKVWARTCGRSLRMAEARQLNFGVRMERSNTRYGPRIGTDHFAIPSHIRMPKPVETREKHWHTDD